MTRGAEQTARSAYRGGRTCPWWLCWSFDNPIRSLVHNAEAVLSPYLSRGQRALDIGPGMGFFTIPMAGMVGPSSTVVALDIQEKMLRRLRSRAERSGVTNIVTRRYDGTGFGLEGAFDFILLFWMLHEVADAEAFCGELERACSPGGTLLVAEPFIHVGAKGFRRSMDTLRAHGFEEFDKPRIGFSRARAFRKA